MKFIRCETCKREAPFENVPSEWITTIQGKAHEHHFCSDGCIVRAHRTVKQDIISPPIGRARRFLLIDESAEETEATLWGNGSISLDPIHDVDGWYYLSWEEFKKMHPGCGITWIDQEGSDAK
jgi:hypothetical protein